MTKSLTKYDIIRAAKTKKEAATCAKIAQVQNEGRRAISRGRSRAEYGKQVVKGLASRLMLFHGSGWDEKTLRHCLRAAETFGEEEIVSAARRQLSWTHIKTLSCRRKSDVMTMPQLAARYNGICHDRFIIALDGGWELLPHFIKSGNKGGDCFRSGPCGCYAVRASHSPNPTPAARANYWEFWSGGEEQFPLAISGKIWYNMSI